MKVLPNLRDEVKNNSEGTTATLTSTLSVIPKRILPDMVLKHILSFLRLSIKELFQIRTVCVAIYQ